MLTTKFKELTLSRLGFGAMRLPLCKEDPSGIDRDQTDRMVSYAIGHGVNYFDTAYSYLGGMSEIVLGESLSRYPRDSYYLASKFPGHQISESYEPAPVFEHQLRKCRTDWFDFYLLHNVYENSVDVYRDPRWKIPEYLVEQKRKGKIRHLGFSFHGQPDLLRDFLDEFGDEMEFCQIQLNYLDWTLQHGEEKVQILKERGIPVWVMEPVRGGKLASLTDSQTQRLAALRPGVSPAEWAFRFLQQIPEAAVILSGMSTMRQMEENVATFEREAPLTKEERAALLTVAEEMKNMIPCTGCRYCCEGCPKQLDIPMLLSTCNELRVGANMNLKMLIELMPEEKKPAACIACGKCAKVCPQGIDIPGAMREMSGLLETVPSWREISRQRDEEGRRQRENA